MKYLLAGCGHEHSKRVRCPESPSADFSDGVLVTWDVDPDVQPDVVHDLDVLPYPFAEGEFDEIHAYECLEHCGTQGDAKFFFGQFAEFWRILSPGGLLALSVPLWNTDLAWGVPDHRRVFPPTIFGFLEPRYYENVGKPGYADYRKLLGRTHFEVLGAQEDRNVGSLYVLMKAVKP